MLFSEHQPTMVKVSATAWGTGLEIELGKILWLKENKTGSGSLVGCILILANSFH